MRLWFFIFLITLLNRASSQNADFKIIDAPSLEVYDLLKDSKGYIWLAHDLGLSRYDGRNFVNFSHPQQRALSMTDLCEDKQGRIWCHNFEGQIFYVDQFKLNLLARYRSDEESTFPRIGICGDEMIATSVKGIFTCNTKKLSTKYYILDKGTSSLTVLKNKVLLYGKGTWYLYRPGIGIEKIEPQNFSTQKNENINLQPTGMSDTAFVISNPEGYYYKLVLRNNKLYLLEKKKTNGFINSITIDKNDAWIHTKSASSKENAIDSIVNYNLTDIIKDDNGNIFLSSLKNGLILNYAQSSMSALKATLSDKNDFVRTLVSNGAGFVCGTQKGKILLLSKESSTKTIEILVSNQQAPVEHLYRLNSNEFIAGTSIGLYTINVKDRKVILIDSNIILKDLAITGSDIFVATSKELLKIPISELVNYNKKGSSALKYTSIKTGRTRALVFNKSYHYLLCSFSDGVYKITENGVIQLLFKGERIYASSMETIHGKIIIGTFNQGIFVIDKERIIHITTKEGLLSNSVKAVKKTGDNIWLIFYGFVQKMDANLQLKPIPEIPFKGSTIYDLVEEQNAVYIATANGVYQLKSNPKNYYLGFTSIDFILINGKDTAVNKTKYSHRQNYLQLSLSTSFFHPFNFLRYKYRFFQKQTSDTSWQISGDDQKNFDLIALRPGKYIFEAIAINPIGQPLALPIVQSIEIRPAWYQTIFFKIISFSATILLLLFLTQFYYRHRMQKQRAQYEQMLAIQLERQRIATEMHDDIGAGLSGVRLLSEMATQKLQNVEMQEEVNKIHSSIAELSSKMREVVWSLNIENDSLENLIYFLERQANQLFENSSIRLIVSMPTELIPEIFVPGEKRRHILLTVKEALHNVIKHSNATQCQLIMTTTKGKLLITIADNGKGFEAKSNMEWNNGMRNMKRHVAEVKGTLTIENNSGTVVKIEIPIT